MILKLEKTKRILAFFLALILMFQVPAEVLAGTDTEQSGFAFLDDGRGADSTVTAASASETPDSDRSATESDAGKKNSRTTGVLAISDTLYWAYKNGKLLITTVLPAESGYTATGDLDAREPGYSSETIPWAAYLSDITEVQVGGQTTGDTVTPYYMNGWFDGLENLTKMDFKKIDTSRTQSFIALFRSCGQLTSLDLSGFNTGKAQDLSEMFRDCFSLSSVNLKGFNTKKVVTFDRMFMNCRSLGIVDLSSFDTSAGTSFNGMFEGCLAMRTIDTGNLDVSNGADLSYMFKGCEQVTELSIANFDTSKTRYIEGLFQDCISLETVNLGEMETNLLSDVSSMFEGCESLTSITGLTTMEMQYVMDMSFMFKNCRSLDSVDLSKMQTLVPVKTMEGMFSGCSSLTAVYMKEIESDVLVSLASMFENCTSLENMSILEASSSHGKNVLAIDTETVQDMSRMFFGCDHLEKLTLYNNMLYVPDMDDMLTGCVRLQSFSKGAKCRLKGYGTESTAGLPSPDKNYIPGATGYWYAKDSTDEFPASDLPDSANEDTFRAVYGSVTYYPNGYDVEPVVDYLEFNKNYEIRGNVFERYTKAELSNPAWNTNASGTGTEYNVNEKYNSTTYSALRDLSLYAQWKESPRATHSVYWKNGENVIKEDHVIHGTMPSYTGPVPQRDGQKFTGWSPEFMPVLNDSTYVALFTEDNKVSVTWDWDNEAGSTPSKKETFEYTLGSMPQYTTVPEKTDPDGVYVYTFSHWEPEVTAALTDTTYTAVYTREYADLLYWSYTDGTLTISSREISGTASGSFRSSLSYNDETRIPWYRYRRLINRVNIGGTDDIVKPVRMDGWFDGFMNLTGTKSAPGFYFTGLNTSGTLSMKGLFRDCARITYLDISSWNTAKVTDFSDFLSGCSFLTALYLPKTTVTAKTVNVSGMFCDLGKIRTIDVSGFNTKNITDFSEMFARCRYLTTLDVSGFNTASGQYFDSMFADCSGLDTLDVSGFSTPKAQSFTEMFRNCSSVKKLDLGNFTVTVGENYVENMFAGMIRLSELTVGVNCDLRKAGLPAPDPEYVEHADGYWHKNGKSYKPTEIREKGTYGPVYGWITYDPNGYSGKETVEYLKYSMKNYKIQSWQNEVPEGKKFAGWTLTPDGSGKVYTASETLTKTAYEKLFGKKLYAQFASIEKTDAKIVWKDYDGSILYQETVPLGSKAKYKKNKPTRKSTAQYSYEFSKWTPEPGIIEADAVYTASYTETLRTYTVTWYNRDKTIVDRKFNVPYGTTPEHTKIIPTFYHEKWFFTFEKWDREPEMVTKDTSYEAVYKVSSKAKNYIIRWENWDGTLLLQETVQENVKPKGPSTTPTRPETASVTYEFAGWEPEVRKATENRTYKAVFNSKLKSYILVWNLNGHGEEVKQSLKVGTEIKRPANPTAVGYNFVNWYYNADGTGDPVDFGDLSMPARSLVIYAKWKKQETGGGGGGTGGGGGSISSAALNKNSGQATFSKCWTTNAEGKWVAIKDGEPVRNAWLCDDAVASNRSDVWYLMKEDGTMLDAGLLQDQTGNFYSLEMRHEGYYGMLRYKDGYYDGIWLEFEKTHNGSFGAIRNADGIEALKQKYGVTYVNFGNQSCVYTSSFSQP